MIVQFTDDLNPNPLSQSEVLEAMIGRFISDIARGASLIRQRSTMLSITDNRQSLADRREQLDDATAAYIARLVNLAQDHGVDALRGLGMIDLEIVRLATAPLDRKKSPAPEPMERHPLDTFNDDRLRDALWALAEALHEWSYLDGSPEEQGALVLDRLANATAALERREEARS